MTKGGMRCFYKGCTNYAKNCPEISFFRFPIKDKERCEKWMKNSGCEDFRNLPEKVFRWKTLCHKHFSKKCLDVTHQGRHKPHHNAVPVPLGTNPDEDDNGGLTAGTSDKVNDMTLNHELKVSIKPKHNSLLYSVNSASEGVYVNLGGNTDHGSDVSTEPTVKACDGSSSSYSANVTSISDNVSHHALTSVESMEKYLSLCRLCCSDSGRKHKIIETFEGNLLDNILLKIQAVISPEANVLDDLPVVVCDVCKEKLDQFYTFKEECRKAEELLRKKYSLLKKEENSRINCSDVTRVQCNEGITTKALDSSQAVSSETTNVEKDDEASGVLDEPIWPQRKDEDATKKETPITASTLTTKERGCAPSEKMLVKFIGDYDVIEPDKTDEYLVKHVQLSGRLPPPDDTGCKRDREKGGTVSARNILLKKNAMKEKESVHSQRTEIESYDRVQNIDKKRKDNGMVTEGNSKRFKECGEQDELSKIPRSDVHVLKNFTDQFKDFLLESRWWE